MSSNNTPSAPPAPESYGHQGHNYTISPPTDYDHHHHQQPPSYMAENSRLDGGCSGFPPDTSQDVIRSFRMVDRDGSGYIDENELQQALSSGYQRFNMRTIRLLMFLFKNSLDALRIGPNEFSALWNCLGQWRATFEIYDRDRSGKIDFFELRDALYGLGYAIPPSVLQVLFSKYDDGSGRRIELNFDSFVECGMIVKVRNISMEIKV
ncbi:probable calcium-binding protein CML48 isoform X2 [Ricinus communis]|uniref:probable calcium-binding protein CML48 isoform X2 n=1 Tax=Ricinus communis TaxID=3988 RepID=UPI000772273B|nr:probable calcium-binding protein CML48 isoform X2 [Ricinus communis]|eukprot:XP_015577637.1 probable calcium-binding protein CML48 isoform X2 [Ricinus communis]